MKNVFLFLWVIVVLSSCNNNHSTRTAEEEYSFFVAGHLYGVTWGKNRNSLHIHEPFKEYIPKINKYPNMAFGIFTGDIVRNSTRANYDTTIHDLQALKMPYYVAPGNHDVGNRELFESYFGDSTENNRSYGYFKYNNDLFIILDANLNHWNIKGEQLKFLKQTLRSESGNSRNIFVFLHQLIFWNKFNAFKNIHLNWPPYTPDTTNYWSEVEPVLAGTKKTIYLFAGDLGANAEATPYMYYQKNNIVYIASGMGNMKEDNFIFVNVDRSGAVSFDLKALQGDPDRLGQLENFKMP